MKKTRVYELAKEFHKETREVLDILAELGIEAVSHATSLEQEDVERVREHLTAAQTHKIVEKRVSSGVIRRRKKKIPQQEEARPAEAPQAEAEIEAEPEAPAAPMEVAPEAPAALEAEPPEAEPAPRPEPPKEEARRETAKPAVAEKSKKAKRSKKMDVGPRAKVIIPAKPEPPAAKPEAPAAQAEPKPKAPTQAPEPEEAKEAPAVEAVEEAQATTAKAAEDKATAEAAPDQPAQEAPTEKAEVKAEESAEKTGEAEEAKPKIKRLKPAGGPKAKVVKQAPMARVIERPEPAAESLNEYGDVRKPRWADKGDRARVVSKPAQPALAPVSKLREQLLGDSSRKPKQFPGKRKGKRRDVSRAELYGGKGGGRYRSNRRKGGGPKERGKTQLTQPKAIKMRIKMAEAISVADLAKRMGVKAPQLIKALMEMGMMVTVNQNVDFETAALVAAEFGYEVERDSFEEAALIKTTEDKPEDLISRPPVVTIMGHVDHGKSSLLEALAGTTKQRDIDIVDGEAGGITQHVGAYRVPFKDGDIIFLDTPGHEAFTAMRARGAQVTDIVVLVVAADDGVMEQTREAVNHSQAAKAPIIVAVNKMDKPDVDPERVKRELAELGLAPEEWGGETLYAHVSAKTGLGLEDLMEAIRLQAEMLELSANPDKPAQGRIIEARLDRGRGPVATVLVQAGTLRVGDSFVVGSHSGKARALLDDRGRNIDEAGPSIPVIVQGLSGVPEAGDDFQVVEDEKSARQISQHRAARQRESELTQTTKISLETFMEQAVEGEVKELKIVLKADVQGSIEAVKAALERLSTDKVKLVVIHSAAGAINESDVMLASASQAIIIGFNVRADSKVAEINESQQVEIRYYDIIYKAVEEIREAMAGLLDSKYRENVLGRAEVRELFKVPKIGMVAGSMVIDGVIRRNAKARLLREGRVIYDGQIGSLKRFKDDAKEVAKGYDCGIGLDNFNDVKVGDEIEAYELEEYRPDLDE